MENLGGEQGIELIKTDDIESEEADIFKRVDKFEELTKRLDKHRQENLKLRGNDLRYNVYMRKMQKLVRMDLGLDIEAFKDYVNNTKQFAKCNTDWDIFGKDDLSVPPGLLVGGDKNRSTMTTGNVNELEKVKEDALWQ